MKFASMTDRLATLGSDKWAVHMDGRRRAAQGAQLIFLSIGEPDLPPPPAVLQSARNAIKPGNTGYKDAAGGIALRSALAQFYSRHMGRAIGLEQFMFVPGTQSALFVAFMAIIDQGDEVILLDPYYATYEAVVSAPGGVPRPVRLDPDRDFHLDFEALERAVTPRTRAILVNSPSNPTGAVFTPEEVAALCAFAKRHDLWVVSDEVYASLVHGARVFTSPFMQADMEERTIVVSSISKSHALPGLRCGWIAASEDFCQRARPIFESMLFSSHPFLEEALITALEGVFPENAAAKHAYFARAQAFVAGIEGANRLRVHLPEGGMFVMLDVRETGVSGETFARRLLDEEGVVTMPGESFGAGGAGHIRIALTVDEAAMAEAAKRIRRLADRV